MSIHQECCQSARVLTYHWYEGADGLASETLRALLASDQSPFRRSQPARVIRVAIAPNHPGLGILEKVLRSSGTAIPKTPSARAGLGEPRVLPTGKPLYLFAFSLSKALVWWHKDCF